MMSEKTKPTLQKLEEVVWVDPERMGGAPCFRGTRIPIKVLFDNLEAGMSLQVFLNEYEGVTVEQAVTCLEFALQQLHAVVLKAIDK